MKKPAHSDTKVIINLSTEHKIQRNGELVAFPRLDKAPRTGGMNFAALGSVFPSGPGFSVAHHAELQSHCLLSLFLDQSFFTWIEQSVPGPFLSPCSQIEECLEKHNKTDLITTHTTLDALGA